MRTKRMITSILIAVLLASLSVQGQTRGKQIRQREQRQQRGEDSLQIDYQTKILELSAKLEKLEKEREEEKKQNELQKLLQQASNLGKQKRQDESDMGRKFYSGLRQQSALNPNISIGGDYYAAYGTSKSEYNRVRSEYSWGTGRMLLREVELAVESALDPFSRAKAFFGIGEEGIEVEEAYGQWLNMPLNMNLKIGQFKTQFGKLNRYHTHALPQFERPFVLTHFLGVECLNGFGVAGNFLLPSLIAHVNELDIEFVTGGENPSFTNEGKHNFIYIGHVKNYYDVNRSTYVEWGLSGATGYNDPDETYRTTLAGADLTVKWSPPDRAKYRGAEWLTEVLYSNRKTPEKDMNAWGIYSSLQYRLSAWWVASIRLDYTQLPYDNSLEEKGAALVFDFWQSEFVFFRFQYTLINRNFDENDNRFIVQTNWAIGPHKHEAY
jgi:hypothetical protein